MVDVIRTIALKMNLPNEQKTLLNNLLNKWGTACQYTVDHLTNQSKKWTRTKEPTTTTCPRCGDEQKIEWEEKNNPENKICGRCHHYQFSYFCLTESQGFQKTLIETFPDLATHKGYYAGVAKYSAQMFKAWQSKVEDRKKELKLLQARLIAETNILHQLALQKVLKKKEEGIKHLEFRCNVLYLGAGSMFDFKEENGMYYLGISDPSKLRSRFWIELDLGRRDSYLTAHNKPKIIDETMQSGEHKKTLGKMLRREQDNGEYLYEFMLPKRDKSKSLLKNEEVLAYAKANPEKPVAVLSFGVYQPLTVIILKSGKVISIKRFGNATLLHVVNHERAYRRKVMKILEKRYKGKWRRSQAKKRFWKHRGNYESNFVKTNNHTLTTNVAQHLLEAMPDGGTIISQDLKGIKGINYPGAYRVVLSRWSVEAQRFFLEYKEMLRDFHLYTIPYRQSNNLECSRCRTKQVSEDKQVIKTLSRKLSLAINKLQWMKQDANRLQEKINKLLTYPSTEENRRWIQETRTQLTQVKEKITTLDTSKTSSIFTCTSCGYTQDIYLNECFQLWNTFSYSLHNGNEVPPTHAVAGMGYSSMPLEPPGESHAGATPLH